MKFFYLIAFSSALGLMAFELVEQDISGILGWLVSAILFRNFFIRGIKEA